MQQMGIGTSQIAMLAVFLDLPLSWSAVNWHLSEVEKIIGPVQQLKKEESEKVALDEEIILHTNVNDLDHREYTMDEHKHPLLPKIKGIYGA